MISSEDAADIKYLHIMQGLVVGNNARKK